MYFHPRFTHSAPPPDTLGALRYHSSDHPWFTSLCHPPDILVSTPCLNSSDLGTSRPQDLWTSGPSDLGTSEPHWHFQTLALTVLPLLFNPFNSFHFPFRNHCMYILCFHFRHFPLDP